MDVDEWQIAYSNSRIIGYQVPIYVEMAIQLLVVWKIMRNSKQTFFTTGYIKTLAKYYYAPV